MIKRVLPFLIAGLLGLVAVGLMHRYLQQQQRALDAERRKLYADYQEPLLVMVAKQDLPEGTVLTAELLEKQEVPKKFMQPYATSRGAELLGLVTRAPIAEGEQIQRNKLQRPEEAAAAATLSGITPKGKRAVTIGADMLTGVGGFVRPGDTVDIVWSFQAPGPTARKGELLTLTLFQNVEVLAVGREMRGRPVADGKERPSGDYSMTLALTPEQTQVLLYAREQGQVQVSLRSQEDQKDGLVEVPPIDSSVVMQAVLGPEAVPQPAAPPRTVEVFKGLERSVVAVNE